MSQRWTHFVTSYPFFDALTGFPTVCSVHGVSPLIGRQRGRVLAVLLVLALDQARLAPEGLAVGGQAAVVLQQLAVLLDEAGGALLLPLLLLQLRHQALSAHREHRVTGNTVTDRKSDRHLSITLELTEFCMKYEAYTVMYSVLVSKDYTNRFGIMLTLFVLLSASQCHEKSGLLSLA